MYVWYAGLREIDQCKIEPFDSDVNVAYFNTVDEWCFDMKVDRRVLIWMYKIHICSVFAPRKYIHALFELKMAQVIDIDFWEENFNSISQDNALWYGKDAIYKFILRHITGLMGLVV